MDERIQFKEQIEDKGINGQVILINKFNVKPDKVEQFLEVQQSLIEAQYVIKNLTKETQIVLDPIMGSGTTGISALKLNRKFIGIEKDIHTFEIAKAKIKNTLLNNSINI